MAKELDAWVTSLRPLFVQEESPLLFCSRSGAPLVQISRKLTELAKSFGASVPHATAVRKAIATAGGGLDSEGKTALAVSMSHSQATADTYYRAYGEAKSVQGFEAVGNILNIDNFLQLNNAQFKGRARRDIYSKVRNLIGRK